MRIADLLPPVIYRLLRPAPPKAPSRSELITYASFEEAILQSKSYSDDTVVRIVFEKTKLLRDRGQNHIKPVPLAKQQVQTLFALQQVFSDKELNRTIDVMDLGGACGYTFTELSDLISERINKWHVIETQATVDIASVFSDSRLGFFSSLDQAVHGVNKDLLFASGVLQYIPDPESALRQWVDMNFRYIYFSRTLVCDTIQKPLISVQQARVIDHGPSVFIPGFSADQMATYPFTLLSPEMILNILKPRYEIKFVFNEDYAHTYQYQGKPLVVRSIGYFCKRIT